MPTPWPTTDEDLVRVQEQLAQDAVTARERAPWRPSAHPRFGGCFVAFARGEAGPGHPGDRAWAAAVVWRPRPDGEPRHGDGALRGMPMTDAPRMAADLEDQSVVQGRVPARRSRSRRHGAPRGRPGRSPAQAEPATTRVELGDPATIMEVRIPPPTFDE